MRQLIIIVGLLSSGFLYSQNRTIELTLDETIVIAVDSSLQSFAAKNAYMAKYWEFRSYKAARLPSLNLTMTPLRYNRNITQRYDSESNMDVYRKQQSLYSSGNLSIRQNLDLTGGTFFLDSELGFLRNFGEYTYSQITTVPVRLGYSQSLFGFNEFKWEKKIEPLKYEKAKKQYLYERESIAETTTRYFFELALAQTEYEMAVENIISTDTLYNIGKERHKIASISQSDLLTLRLDAVNAKNTLKNAEIALKRSMQSFASFLNFEENVDVKVILPNRPKNVYVLPEAALEYANSNNPDFIASEQTILEAKREVDRTEKSSNFDAAFSASVGFNQAANTFHAAYMNLLQQDVLSISLTIPLVDWGVRKGKANMAKSNLNITELNIRQKISDLKQDILMTVEDFNIQQDLIISAEEALDLANMAYDNTKERFIIGKADINSLTLSLNRQNLAQKNYISALKNYWISYYKIRRQTLYDFENSESLSVSFDELFLK